MNPRHHLGSGREKMSRVAFHLTPNLQKTENNHFFEECPKSHGPQDGQNARKDG